MTQGVEFNLVVPVLAGLNAISIAARPTSLKCFLTAHFLYGWLAYDFQTVIQASKIPLGLPMVTYSRFCGMKNFIADEAHKIIHEGITEKLSSRGKALFEGSPCYGWGALSSWKSWKKGGGHSLSNHL